MEECYMTERCMAQCDLGRGFRVMDRFLEKQRLLVIAPHADDETIGCGGLIAKVKDHGGEVFVQVATVSDLEHYDGRDGVTFAHTRSQELAEAMRVLDVDDHEMIFEDRDLHLRLDAMPRRDLVAALEKSSRLSIDRLKPTMIALPAPSFNQDHVAIYEAGITASRPHLASLKPFQKNVLVADSPQLAWNSQPFHPHLYVDISGEYLNRKLEAFSKHESQQRPGPSMGGIDALRVLALQRGREISVEAAEAYQVLRIVV